MLKAEGKISDAVIENMLTWRHSGFNGYCGPTIWPHNEQGLMKVIALIEDDALIKKMLIPLGLCETRNHDPPQSNDAPSPTIETELAYDYTYSQLPPIDYWTQ